MATRIYVGGLHSDVSDEELIKLFSTHGKVVSIDIQSDVAAETPTSIAFISIEGAQEAQKAMTALNGKDFMGRKIRVNQARTMQDTGASGVGRRSF